MLEAKVPDKIRVVNIEVSLVFALSYLILSCQVWSCVVLCLSCLVFVLCCVCVVLCLCCVVFVFVLCCVVLWLSSSVV